MKKRSLLYVTFTLLLLMVIFAQSTLVYGDVIPINEVRIDFTTNGDSTMMRCDFDSSATAVWHWADGTTTDASSGSTITKDGLGDGNHDNYLVISDGSALTRFGAGSAAHGNLVSMSGLENCSNLDILYAYLEDDLNDIGETENTLISEYHLAGTDLSETALDEIFADAVANGVENGRLWANNAGTYVSNPDKTTLVDRGWYMSLPTWPEAPNTEVRIDFTTNGDSTMMRCDFDSSATAVWHWADGTTTDASSGSTITKDGLGDGNHDNYLVISDGSALTRFGAGSAAHGNLVSMSGLENCSNLDILYAYLEDDLNDIGETENTLISEYHLAGTDLSETALDEIFADAVANGVENGRLWANNAGTYVSNPDKTTLVDRGWYMSLPTWPEAPNTEVRIDFTTNGDSTMMRCDFDSSATAVWHWADGTTTDASSGSTITKDGLGDGNHDNYLVISDGSALTRFGAGSAAHGNLVSMSGLENCSNLDILYAYLEDDLNDIGETENTLISEYHLAGTDLSETALDEIFADAVANGVENGRLWANNAGTYVSNPDKTTLVDRGWYMSLPTWPEAPNTEVRIDFTTNGDSTMMRCDFDSSATAVWHWADGTTTDASSGSTITKDGLGDGNHDNYLVISDGSALTRFGAGSAAHGNLVSMSGLENCSNLDILYAYLEDDLNDIGETENTLISEYHLAGTDLSETALDEIFADAVANGVENGRLWANNAGTYVSNPDKTTLVDRGWYMSLPTWPEAPNTEVRIDFTTNGDSTMMRCDFDSSATAVWHWADGTTTDASSGSTITKDGLGDGNHDNYLVISDGSALTRFGAGSAAHGNLVSMSGLENCSNLDILYAYLEDDLNDIGETENTLISEYHLAGTDLSETALDEIFADAVANGVENGRLWANNAGTYVSNPDKTTLVDRGWYMSLPTWPEAPNTEVRIDFTTSGDTTMMRCDFDSPATAVWHWSDGSTTTANSGVALTKPGLGAGNHDHYLLVSNGTMLTRFGAGNEGAGNLLSVTGLDSLCGLTNISLYLK